MTFPSHDDVMTFLRKLEGAPPQVPTWYVHPRTYRAIHAVAEREGITDYEAAIGLACGRLTLQP